jgi:uncharacterized protein YkwD
MKRWMAPFVGLVVVAAVLVHAPARASVQTDYVEGRLLQLINQGRSGQGKGAERMHAGLRSKARAHSSYQSSIRALTHSGFSGRVNGATPDPVESNGAPDDGFTGAACENVGYYYPGSAGATADQIAQTLYNGWYNSTGHRNCMFDASGAGYNAAGPGIYLDSRGYWWATFISVRDLTLPKAGTWTRVEQSGSGVSYTGSGWVTKSNTSASGGSYRVATSSGNTVRFAFTGTGFRWVGLTTVNGGIASVKIDGVSLPNISAYSSSTVWRKTLLERTGLVNTSHVLEVTVTGTKSSQASSTNVYVDAFEYLR